MSLDRSQDHRRRALGRLGPDRQRRWAEVGALRRRSPSFGPSRRQCGRRRCDEWSPDATFVPGSDEEGGGRWVRHRDVPPSWPLARGKCPLPCQPDAVPPSRLLSRHGAAMGLDARAGRGCRSPEPVRLYRGRHAAAVAKRARGWSMSMHRRSRSRAAGPMPPCRAWPNGRSAGSSTMPPNSPRAKCGAGAAMTASCSTRPSSAGGRRARFGGWRSISRRCWPIAASCSTRTAASWC